MIKQQLKQIKEQNEQEAELIPYGEPVQNTVNLPLDLKNPDRTWDKHKIVTYKILLQNEYGKTFDNRALKAITQNNYLRAIVGRNYLVYPHEEIDEIVKSYTNDQSSGLEMLGTPKISYHGLNKHWVLMSNKIQTEIKTSKEKNDLVKFGVAIRNSIGGRLAFGIDIMSYRVVCSNGAIAGFRDFGSYSLRHYGKNTEKMTNVLTNMIHEALGRAIDIGNYYTKFAKTKLGNNKELLDTLAKFIPLKYFPEWINITMKDKRKDIERSFTIPFKSRQKSLWELFNEFTANIWHEKDLSFDMTRFTTKKLHEILIQEVSRN